MDDFDNSDDAVQSRFLDAAKHLSYKNSHFLLMLNFPTSIFINSRGYEIYSLSLSKFHLFPSSVRGEAIDWVFIRPNNGTQTRIPDCAKYMHVV